MRPQIVIIALLMSGAATIWAGCALSDYLARMGRAEDPTYRIVPLPLDPGDHDYDRAG